MCDYEDEKDGEVVPMCDYEDEKDGEVVPPEVAEQMWQDAVEAFHGVGPYALENQD